MDDTPNFLKPKQLQECKEFAMWQINLAIAHFLLLGIGMFVGIFMENYLVGILFVIGSWFIFVIAGRQTRKHVEWHIKNKDKEKH